MRKSHPSQFPVVEVPEIPTNGLLTVNDVVCAVYRLHGVLIAVACIKGMPGATSNLLMPESHFVRYRVVVK
jgi:hypothetical protein